MKKLQIFEAAMCCSTGLCGIGVDPELLRVSTVFNSLKEKWSRSGEIQPFRFTSRVCG